MARENDEENGEEQNAMELGRNDSDGGEGVDDRGSWQGSPEFHGEYSSWGESNPQDGNESEPDESGDPRVERADLEDEA
ncbi:hypothetical protein PQX77_017410 [Marasmius sp. AFHP31]|nr:hypothetical protein PQX77_017410 [Marasmius sp. AFHP31]